METEWYEPSAGKHKYSDVWRPDWREDVDLLARPQKSICALCGLVLEGTARELILAFREHRVSVHGQKVQDLKRRAETRLLMLDEPSRKLSVDGADSNERGRENSVAARRHTREELLAKRDVFYEVNNRMPSSKDEGFSSGSVFIVVKRLFGSWRAFQEHDASG